MSASMKAVKIYRAEGVTGMFSSVNQCYAQLNQKKPVPRKEIEFCVAMDMSGLFLDYSTAQASGFPRDQRFSDDAASNRMHNILGQLGLSKNIADTQKYLGSRNERVQRFTSRAMSLDADNPAKSDGPQKCVDREMAKWEKKRDKEISKTCAELAKKGEECRVSAGQESLMREEALEKIKPQCR